MCIHPSIHPFTHPPYQQLLHCHRSIPHQLLDAIGLKDLVCAWNSRHSPTRGRPWPGAGWNGYKGPGLEDEKFKKIKFYLYDDGPNDMRAAEACMRVSGTCPLDMCVHNILVSAGSSTAECEVILGCSHSVSVPFFVSADDFGHAFCFSLNSFWSVMRRCRITIMSHLRASQVQATIWRTWTCMYV